MIALLSCVTIARAELLPVIVANLKNTFSTDFKLYIQLYMGY